MYVPISWAKGEMEEEKVIATRRYRFADGTTVQRGDDVDASTLSESEFLKVFQMGVLAPDPVSSTGSTGLMVCTAEDIGAAAVGEEVYPELVIDDDLSDDIGLSVASGIAGRLVASEPMLITVSFYGSVFEADLVDVQLLIRAGGSLKDFYGPTIDGSLDSTVTWPIRLDSLDEVQVGAFCNGLNPYLLRAEVRVVRTS